MSHPVREVIQLRGSVNGKLENMWKAEIVSWRSKWRN